MLLLNRKTNGKAYIPEIDGLRFFAIIPVVLMHLSTALIRDLIPIGSIFSVPVLILSGGCGVPLFFVISGFVLSLPFAKYYFKNGNKIKLSKYYLKRFTRIEPPYIVCILIFYFLLTFVLHANNVSFSTLVYSLFYSHNIITGTWSSIDPVIWSLETEIQFYVLAPIFFLIYSINNLKLRMLLYLILFFTSNFFIYLNYDFLLKYHLHKSLLYYFSYFLIGQVCSDFLVNFKKVNFNKYIGYLLGIPTVIAYFYFGNYSDHLFIYLGYILLFFVMFLAMNNGLKDILSLRLFYTIGGMCYSIYLIHYPILSALTLLTKKLLPNLQLYSSYFFTYLSIGLPILIIVLFISIIYFILIERPCMDPNWPNKLLIYLKLKKSEVI